MKNIILILIALILFSCSNYPENWNIDMSKKNAVMVLIDGTKIQGELKSFNYDTDQDLNLFHLIIIFIPVH